MIRFRARRFFLLLPRQHMSLSPLPQACLQVRLGRPALVVCPLLCPCCLYNFWLRTLCLHRVYLIATMLHYTCNMPDRSGAARRSYSCRSPAGCAAASAALSKTLTVRSKLQQRDGIGKMRGAVRAGAAGREGSRQRCARWQALLSTPPMCPLVHSPGIPAPSAPAPTAQAAQRPHTCR